MLSKLDSLHVGDITGYFCTPQKASIGMYSECDYLYKSCMYTFWPCHPYFILQFYSIVFVLVSVCFLFFIALSVIHQCHLTRFAHSTLGVISRRWDVLNFAKFVATPLVNLRSYAHVIIYDVMKQADKEDCFRRPK